MSRRNLNLNWHVSRSRLFWTLTAICVDSFHSPLMSCGLRRPNLHRPVPGAPCSCRAHTLVCVHVQTHTTHTNHPPPLTNTYSHQLPSMFESTLWLTKIWSRTTSRGVSVIFLHHTHSCVPTRERRSANQWKERHKMYPNKTQMLHIILKLWRERNTTVECVFAEMWDELFNFIPSVSVRLGIWLWACVFIFLSSNDVVGGEPGEQTGRLHVQEKGDRARICY